MGNEDRTSPYVDLAYDRTRYEQDKEMIARGVDPYNSEYALGCEDYDIEYSDFEDNIKLKCNNSDNGRIIKNRCRADDRSNRNVRINGYKIGYEDARQIVSNFSRENRYLRSLISRVTGSGSYADSLDYRGLLREGYKIRGVAAAMLKKRALR